MAISTAILQTQLKIRLPPDFTSQFPDGVSIAYAAIPAIRTLDEPLKDQVRNAFGESLQVVWQTMIGISGLGLLSAMLMKGLPLHTEVDEKWALEGRDASAETVAEVQKTTEPPAV